MMIRNPKLKCFNPVGISLLNQNLTVKKEGISILVNIVPIVKPTLKVNDHVISNSETFIKTEFCVAK